jgi:hypothetical protein
MRRASTLALLDQGIWAITNFLAVAAIAHAVGRSSFGVFSIALSVMIVVSGVTVASAGETLGVTNARLGIEDPAARAQALEPVHARALGLACVSGVIAPVLVAGLVAAYSVDALSSGVLWAVLVAAPAAVFAEAGRSCLYGLRRVPAALMISSAWLVGQVASLVVIATVRGELDLVAGAVSWVVGAWLSAVVAVVTNRTMPALRGASTDEWRRRRSFSYEFLATAGATHATVLVAGALVGLAASGSLRALQTVYGPLNVALIGLRNIIVPSSAGRSPQRRLRVGIILGTGSALLAAALTAVLAVAPVIGRTLLSDAWPAQVSLLLAFAVGRVALSSTVGALTVLRSADATKLTVRLRSLSSVLQLVPFVVGLALGLEAALWASGAGLLVAAVCWWWVAARSATALVGESLVADGA